MDEANAKGVSHTPPSRRRVLLFALAPVALLLLLTGGVRLANEAASRLDAMDQSRWRGDDRGIRHGVIQDSLRGFPASPARKADPATQSRIEGTVRGQLSAMTSGDFASALQFSAPSFREFQSPEQFRQMVSHGFPAMTDAHKIRFQPARIRAGGFGQPRQGVVEVIIDTTSGTRTRFLYMLNGDQDGWTVLSVAPIGMPGPPRRQIQTMPPAAPQDEHEI